MNEIEKILREHKLVPVIKLDSPDQAEPLGRALMNSIPYFAGCCTPTEIIMCISRGYEVVKFFPAKQYGGVDTIKALAAPFPGFKFMPTGGVNASNFKDYLACDKVIACGGSWMVDGKLVAADKFDEIEALVKEAVAAVR